MKKAVSLLISVLLVLSVVSSVPFGAGALEADGACGDSLNWNFDASTGTLTLSGSGDMYNYNDDASPAPWINAYRTQIKSVVCENGVTSIGSKAFMNCTSIESVDLGNTLRGIGWYAFYGCSSLSGVAIPDSVTGVWSGCFQNCTSISWVNLGSGLSDLAPYMFAGCSNSGFWWVSIPENVKIIGEHAFDGCSNLSWNTIAGTGITFNADCFKNIKSDATFLIADAATRKYLSDYWSGWLYRCIDDKHSAVGLLYNPTCTQEGYTAYTCSVCGAVFNDNYTPALGHSYQLASASPNDYYYNFQCTRCGQTDQITALTLKNDLIYRINEQRGNANYKYELDINGDGIINARDYALIRVQNLKADKSLHTTTVNESSTHQTMLGFGASAVWWSQIIGGWDDSQVDLVMKLLYDEEEGIGLNIYRYNLGAGSQNDPALSVERKAECFLQQDGTYNWNADANAQKCLSVANHYCDNMRVTLFSNSAPIFYTKNGRAYGEFIPEGSNYKTNLDSANYQKHADFVVACAEHFTDAGYRITDISPINEPEWAWGANDANYNSAGQEGCHFDKGECREFYKKCISAINNSSVKNLCEIEMWESGQMGGSGTSFESYLKEMLFTRKLGSWDIDPNKNAELRNYFNTISMHSYWVDQTAREKTANLLNGSPYSGYKRSVTEYCQMDGSSSGLGIEYGLDLADTIYQDLTILDVQEWDWWVAVAGGGYMDGLLYVDYTNPNSSREIQTSKRFWVMGNYAKFTNEGSVRIDAACTDGMKVCGFKNTDGSLALIYINTGNNDNYTYLDSANHSTFSTYVTDESRNLEKVQSDESIVNGVMIPANSVTTVVVK